MFFLCAHEHQTFMRFMLDVAMWEQISVWADEVRSDASFTHFIRLINVDVNGYHKFTSRI